MRRNDNLLSVIPATSVIPADAGISIAAAGRQMKKTRHSCACRNLQQSKLRLQALLTFGGFPEPLFAVECKTGDKALNKHLVYFSKRTDIPHFYQIHMGKDDYEIADFRARVMPFTRFVSEVLKV